jgi:tetratricopeptide (TPR) repeat protein
MPFKLWPPKHTDPVSEATERLKENPRDIFALMDRAEALFARRDAKSALRDIDRSLQIVILEPKLQGDARSVLLSRLYTMQSRAFLGLGDHAKALTVIEKVLNELPNHVDALAQRGRILRESGDLNRALKDFDRAIELDDGFAMAYLGRGMTRYDIGDYKGALADYTRAIQLEKTLGVAWSNRGRVYLDLNDLKQAERDFKTAIRLEPGLIGAYVDLAFIARQRGKLNEAFRLIDRGLKQHPHEPALLVELARTYVAVNRLSQALSALDTALQQSPDHAKAPAVRRQAYGRSGDLSVTLADLSRAVELGPYNAETRFNYALAHWQAGHPEEALAAFSRVLQLTPDDSEARTWRARLVLLLGLEMLDEVARLLEDFLYSHCGPGRKWKVELRQMLKFRPDGPPETVNAALVDLCQTPQALLQVTATPTEYTVTILAERPIPGTPQTGFSDAITETVPARPEALLDLFNGFLDKGILVKAGNQLRYTGKVQ